MMRTEIIKMLQTHRHDYISGEEISKIMNVSRTAVWKIINQLRQEGYDIESSPHKGYRLVSQSCDLNQSELEIALSGNDVIKRVVYLQSIDSTNKYAKELGHQENFESTLVIAETQTLGRGRLGRTWASGEKQGIWMSLLLKPTIQPTLAARMTLLAAAAVSEAIDAATGLCTFIKWPNDIILDDKKVCGILTEMSAELNHINYLVLGIGINVNQIEFPAEIQEKATSLKNVGGQDYNRLEIVVKFIEIFSKYYRLLIEENDFGTVIEYVVRKSATLDREVDVTAGANKRRVFAKDIDENGNLIVINESGEEEAIFYGEVSVRGINGYV
ncbi:biotin--[acetyl-CoA-carboxylase] ligase [Fusibacter paucivorans]|uniref:Bifunctional ligase/repressor BirA n=1 Tax=Fusibacter paucivorans TaxID=76009 RepID=A0ABS5PUG0_9FIRM|nr:biotin--[acetyl-CoA-carboxylase] ligase [Fusibacter paucivorans]MBS7528800.1 biotin--[acetyl-CoA-carboxylase] ligase [Fusibacter paucivorans]